MKIIQVMPGSGMTINVSPQGTQMSGNATVTDMSAQQFIQTLQTLSGADPGGEDEEDWEEDDESDTEDESECMDSATVSEEETVPDPVYPEHLSSRWILSIPRREGESTEDHTARTDRIGTYVQAGLEKEYGTLSASVSFTLGTLMGSTTIPLQIVTAEVSGFNAIDECNQSIATHVIVQFGTRLFEQFQ